MYCYYLMAKTLKIPCSNIYVGMIYKVLCCTDFLIFYSFLRYVWIIHDSLHATRRSSADSFLMTFQHQLTRTEWIDSLLAIQTAKILLATTLKYNQFSWSVFRNVLLAYNIVLIAKTGHKLREKHFRMSRINSYSLRRISWRHITFFTWINKDCIDLMASI